MNMPGFTAESSIYKTSKDYQIGGVIAQFVADTSSILPAQMLGWGIGPWPGRALLNASSCVCPCKILVCDDKGHCSVVSC